MSTPIEFMNSYKGTSIPAMIPIIGILFGLATPYTIYSIFEWNNSDTSSLLLSDESDKVRNLFKGLQCMLLPAILFFTEFLFGAMARSKSIKAGFSPAAAQASGIQPFDIVEANRIHQNHIESACIYIPLSFATVGVGINAHVIVATTITWMIGRFLYRVGYRQHHNPLWRLVGVEASLTQSFICFGLIMYAMYHC